MVLPAHLRIGYLSKTFKFFAEIADIIVNQPSSGIVHYMSLFACPRCSDVLDRKEVEYFEIDVCPTCAGIWLDAGELVKLELAAKPKLIAELQNGEADGPVPPPSQKISCPACSGNLGQLDVLGTTVDQCGKCQGLWLDQGELSPVLTALRTSRNPGLVNRLIGISLNTNG